MQVVAFWFQGPTQHPQRPPAPVHGTNVPVREITAAPRLEEIREVSPRSRPSPASARPRESFDRFWQVWAKHHDYLRKQSLKLMAGNLPDAEDALSVAMLNGHRAFSAHVIHNERAWLTRVLHNACMDHYRNHRRYSKWPEQTDPREVEPIESPFAARPQSPEDDLLGREHVADLLVTLLSLPDTLLEPLVMRCFQDMAYSEIAERLNLTNAAVRKRVELARKKMRKSN